MPTWPDGSKHTISWAQHLADMAAPKKGQAAPAGSSGTVAIGNTLVTPAQWASGALAQALAPGSAAAGSGAGGGAPPIDPALQAALAGIDANTNTTVSGLESQRPQVLANYGYKSSGVDANGAPTGLTFDPSNPYSRAALLLKNYNQRQAGTTNSMAARGQLYSGALANANASNESGYNASSDALVKALVQAFSGINQRIASTKSAGETQKSQQVLNRAPIT